jgi:hypothetical protein
MRSFAGLVGLAALAAAIVLFWAVQQPVASPVGLEIRPETAETIDVPGSDAPESVPAASPDEGTPNAAAAVGSPLPGGAIPVGATREVDFFMDESTRERLTEREGKDQLRDWLLYTAVSSQGLSAEDLNRVLFDVPAVRHGYMHPVANFEYDVIRSCPLGDGTILALIPSGGDPQRRDHLAHIADEHRKNLGTRLERLFVFEYELDADSLLATLRRTEDIPGDELFQASYGYYEATIRGLQELTDFLNKVQDVTYASVPSAGFGGQRALVLGGRRLAGRTYRGLRVEDVAAVWQAQEKLDQGRKQLEAEFALETEALRQKWQAKLDELNRQQRDGILIPERRLPGLDPSDDLLRRFGLGRDTDYKLEAQRLQQGYDAEAEKLHEDQARRFIALRLPEGTGFSLDPTYAFDELAEHLSQCWNELKASVQGGLLGISAAEIEDAQDALEAGDRSLFWKLVERIEQRDSALAGAIRQLLGQWIDSASHAGDFDLEQVQSLVAELRAMHRSAESSDFGPNVWLKDLQAAREALAEGDPAPFQALLERLKQGDDLASAVFRRSLADAEGSCRQPLGDLGPAVAVLDEVLAELRELPGTVAALGRACEGLRDGERAAWDAWSEGLGASSGIVNAVLSERVTSERRRFMAGEQPDLAGMAWAMNRLHTELAALAESQAPGSLLALIEELKSYASQGDMVGFERELARLEQQGDGIESDITEELNARLDTLRPLDAERLAARVAELAGDLESILKPSEETVDRQILKRLDRAIERSDQEELDEIVGRYGIRAMLSKLLGVGSDPRAFFVEELAQRLGATRSADWSTVLPRWNELADELAEFAKPGRDGVGARDFEAAVASLRGKANDNAAVSLLILIDRLQAEDGQGAALLVGTLKEMEQASRFQRARYDGDLQGTEVGMILFYTDLLAKLWVSVDYNAPRDAVPEFRTGPDGGVAPIYQAETQMYPSTRLWFGPEARRYHIIEDRSGVLFARCATRIFAASSNPLAPGEEVPASFQAERRMGWWNDHYEEVARYEPEYERLNEYIKWSVIIAWLYGEGKGDALAFLRDVSVDREAWFADWAAANPQLRFEQWEKVGFYPNGHKGSKTESLPILFSRPFASYGSTLKTWTISGGVSGGSPSEIKLRPSVPRDLPQPVRLSARGLDLGQPYSRDSLATLRGTRHTFSLDGTASRMVAKPADAVGSLRSPYAQLRSVELERTVSRTGSDLRVQTVAKTETGPTGLGELRIEPRGNGFRVGYRSRDIDLGQSLARDLSRSDKPPLQMLAGDSRVECVIQRDGGVLLVKLNQSDRWLRLQHDPQPAPEIGADWTARVADTSVGARNYNLAWVEPGQLPRELGSGEYLRIELRPLVDQRSGIPVLARGPPDGQLPADLRPVEIASAAGKFTGRIDPAAESVLIRVEDLPTAFRNRPQDLTSLFRRTDPAVLRKQLAVPDGAVRITDWLPGGESRQALVAALERGDKAAASRLLAANPVEAHRMLQADLTQRLPTIDGYLRQGRHVECLDLLDRALRVHPQSPELLLRKGAAEVGRGRLADAVSRKVAPYTREGEPALLNEIGRMLREPGLSDAQRAYFGMQQRAALLRDLKARGATSAEARGAILRDRAALEVDLGTKPALERVTADKLDSRSYLYIDDVPGLNNLDWSPAAAQATARQAMSGGAALYRVNKPDAVFRIPPDIVRPPQSGGTQRYVWTAALGGLAIHELLGLPFGAASGDEEEDEEDDDERSRDEERQEETAPGEVPEDDAQPEVFILMQSE